MSLFGGDVFASLDDLPYRQGSSVDDSDSDTIFSASSEENYDEGDDDDNDDEDNVSCEEDDTELEDDHDGGDSVLVTHIRPIVSS